MQCITCKQNFQHLPGDLEFYAKMAVPEPIECPDCRQQHRVAWRNFTNLYLRKCELTGKEIISRYSPESQIKIINVPDWHSDKWNALDYGREYDPSRSIFEQMDKLYREIPHGALWQNNTTNCDYTNLAAHSNNCYMVFGCVANENCYYGHLVWNSQDCFDCLYVYKCELCYQAIDCVECYGLNFCGDCTGCNNCRYCYYSKGCQDCTGCYGLVNQKRHVLNKLCSSDQEYQKQSQKFLALSKEERETKINELKKNIPIKENTIIGSVNCSGNYIYYSKNCQQCYDTKASEDASYCYTLQKGSDVMDSGYTAWGLELSYNILASYGRNMISCQGCLDTCTNLYYCQECNGIKDCFGCIGLHQKEQYCILNKKYSETEYNKLKSQIIADMIKRDEWGRFFPIKDSPFGYNETMANEYYPLTKEQALSKGYNWLEPNPRDYQKSDYQIPEDIKEVGDDIIGKTLACETCRRNYKIIKQELEFYRQHDLAVPKECFYCRHTKRMAKRNPRKLFERPCDFCHKQIKTTYSPERPEKVYCEDCYQKEIY